MKNLVMIGRLVFGAWMLVNGVNHFGTLSGSFSLFAEPVGTQPLAVQLMAAFNHSSLINVAYAIQLIGGALVLAGVFTPFALCALMPVSTCAAYWAVVLEHEPVGALLALVAFALNGLLMLAYVDYYKGVLARYAPTLGEA